jgi:acetyltransferase-like isoleucine patch superfamily enzyme/glycosyltransferase involved in cell wall biosynthesis
MNALRNNLDRVRALGRVFKALRYYLLDKARLEASIAEMRYQLDAIAAQTNEIAARLVVKEAETDHELFAQLLQTAARAMAACGDHRLVPAFNVHGDVGLPAKKLKVGLFDNLANQAYVTARALRRLGHDVEVVLQTNLFDMYVMAHPQWEDCEAQGIDPMNFDVADFEWLTPDYVKNHPYDFDRQVKFQSKFEAVSEVKNLYKENFGKNISSDVALLLSQFMGHWDYIRAMNDYDVVVLSMNAITLGIFSPKPVVLCPLGNDVYTRGFEEDVGGLITRASFRHAAHISVPETDYFAYLDRMETKAPRSFMPLIVDTEVYCPGEEPELRAEWQAKVGGEHFLLGVCRQDWVWKGSDRLIRGFARFRAEQPEAAAGWRLLLQSWGPDLEASRGLVTELGLDEVSLWLDICSKPLLRRRQRAADAVADQFVMEGYGISVLESLAAGKPVLIRPVPETSKHHFRTAPPPFIGATTEEEIVAALLSLTNTQVRRAAGQASRKWVEAEHGYRMIGPLYMAMFEAASTLPSEQLLDGQTQRIDLAKALVDAHHIARDDVRQRWNRVLPLPELFTDRWEKAKFLGFGEGTSIYDSVMVLGEVEVGSNSWIGPNCVMDGSGGLKIGSHCCFSAGTQIYSHNSVAKYISGGKSDIKTSKTIIGNNVYTGPNVIISAGSNIGNECIIGASSLVKGDIPDRSFVAGSPAIIVGYIHLDDLGNYKIEIIDNEQENSV